MIRSTFIVLILAAGFQLGAALLPVDPNAFFTVPASRCGLNSKEVPETPHRRPG